MAQADPEDTQQPVMFFCSFSATMIRISPCFHQSRHYPHPHMASKELTADYLRFQDCLVIVTDHSADDWERILELANLVVDTRNATRNMRGITRKLSWHGSVEQQTRP